LRSWDCEMKKAVILKGKYEVIIMPENSTKAEKLYDKLEEIFKSRDFQVEMVESKPDYSIKNKISKETYYLIGHSRGANKILKELAPEKFPKLKGIILFDPLNFLKNNWNKIILPKILFGSRWGEDYTEFKGTIKLKDDHYFNDSFEQIEKNIIKFLDSQE